MCWRATSGLRALLALAPESLSRIGTSRIDLTVFGVHARDLRRVGRAVLARAGDRAVPDRRERLAPAAGRGRPRTPVRYRTRATLVVVQIALSVVLLIGAGLLVRAFVEVQRVDIGFRTDRHLTFRVALPESRYRKHRGGSRRRGGAAATAGGASRRDWRRRHQPSSVRRPAELGLDVRARGHAAAADGGAAKADTRAISTGLLETLGVQLVEGRFFTDDDEPEEPGRDRRRDAGAAAVARAERAGTALPPRAGLTRSTRVRSSASCGISGCAASSRISRRRSSFRIGSGSGVRWRTSSRTDRDPVRARRGRPGGGRGVRSAAADLRRASDGDLRRGRAVDPTIHDAARRGLRGLARSR